MFSRRTGWKLSPNRFTDAQREARAKGKKILDLTLSNPTRAGLAYDTESILGSLSRPEAMDYDPQPKGLASAREAVAAYYREQSGEAAIDKESVVLTTSTSEGYSYIFRLLCNAGDEVLVPKPSYPLFEFLGDLEDVSLIPYPLLYDHGWQIDFHSLQNAVTTRTRAVVLVHPNNPTGSYVSSGERQLLNSLCREHQLTLIVDEVFLDYPHDGTRRKSFTGNREVLTFTLSGLSKISGLPQMKLAWVATSGPERHVKEAMDRLEVIADTYLSMSAPIQLAAPMLLEARKKIQRLLLERVRTNLAELDHQLASQKTCQRLTVEGGWYAVVRVPVTRSDEDLAIDILQQISVLVHPGHFYDFPTDGYLIVSLLTPTAEFGEGTQRMLNFLNAEQGRSIESLK
jgi:alanine-synthesizing transaminase